MIKPHGGQLVNRIAVGEVREELLGKAAEMPGIILNRQQLGELENIATGLYSPLEGFLDELNYYSVINEMRMGDGTVWTLPIVLAVTEEEAKSLRTGSQIALKGEDGVTYGILDLEDKYLPDLINEAEQVYQTVDDSHPGVANLYNRGEVLLGGRITLLKQAPLPGI